jgi:hypothetical protein
LDLHSFPSFQLHVSNIPSATRAPKIQGKNRKLSEMGCLRCTHVKGCAHSQEVLTRREHVELTSKLDCSCLYCRTCAAAGAAWVNPTNATIAPTT